MYTVTITEDVLTRRTSVFRTDDYEEYIDALREYLDYGWVDGAEVDYEDHLDTMDREAVDTDGNYFDEDDVETLEDAFEEQQREKEIKNLYA